MFSLINLFCIIIGVFDFVWFSRGDGFLYLIVGIINFGGGLYHFVRSLQDE